MDDKTSKILRQKLEMLERENKALKKSLYDLSVTYNSLAYSLQPIHLGDILDSALDGGIATLLESSEVDRIDSFGTASLSSQQRQEGFQAVSPQT
jgi:hypothetical protein